MAQTNISMTVCVYICNLLKLNIWLTTLFLPTSERINSNNLCQLARYLFVYCEQVDVDHHLQAWLEVEGSRSSTIVIQSELQEGQTKHPMIMLWKCWTKIPLANQRFSMSAFKLASKALVSSTSVPMGRQSANSWRGIYTCFLPERCMKATIYYILCKIITPSVLQWSCNHDSFCSIIEAKWRQHRQCPSRVANCRRWQILRRRQLLLWDQHLRRNSSGGQNASSLPVLWSCLLLASLQKIQQIFSNTGPDEQPIKAHFDAVCEQAKFCTKTTICLTLIFFLPPTVWHCNELFPKRLWAGWDWSGCHTELRQLTNASQAT